MEWTPRRIQILAKSWGHVDSLLCHDFATSIKQTSSWSILLRVVKDIHTFVGYSFIGQGTVHIHLTYTGTISITWVRGYHLTWAKPNVKFVICPISPQSKWLLLVGLITRKISQSWWPRITWLPYRLIGDAHTYSLEFGIAQRVHHTTNQTPYYSLAGPSLDG